MNHEAKYLLDTRYVTSKRNFYHYHHRHNAPKNKAQLKKIIVIFVFICFFSYVFIDFNLKTKIVRLKDRFDFSPKVDALPENISQAYFVDTPGCRMPSFNVVDDTILQYMSRDMKYTCKKAVIRKVENEGLTLNIDKKEFLELYNITSPEKVSCYYQELRRKTDDENDIGIHRYKLNISQNQVIKVRKIEFVKVVCQYMEEKPFYKDYHFFVVPKVSKKTATTTINSLEFDDTSKNHRTSSEPTANFDRKISVMVIGVDSLSRLNFLRQMNRTAVMLRDNLNSVEFLGYNKVGDNTYPNLVPVLSGLEMDELNLTCLVHGVNGPYDNCPLIWKKFKEAGYKTVFAEDMASLSLFNYYRKGFIVQPTDYYLRPVLVEMEDYILIKHKANFAYNCLGGRRPVDVVLEFMKQLIPFFKRDLFFSFFWMASLSHDYWNMPYLLDDDIVELFDVLRVSGILNRTIIFLMSDHGLRWGSFRETYQGMMEERQPLFVSIFPDWFAQRYPLAVTNLRDNANKLTTHYDLHATFLDLLDLSSLESSMLEVRASELKDSDTIPRGISLFLPVPVTRTCENAGIASHWCTCHQKQILPTNDVRVQRAARYVVKLINSKIKSYPQCRKLYLNSIAEAIIGVTNQKVLKEAANYLIDITVRVQTKPGLGEFESTVRMSSYTTQLTGTISRINMYGSQSYCIDDYTLKMFCYCHR